MMDSWTTAHEDLNSYTSLREIMKAQLGIHDVSTILKGLKDQPDRIVAIVAGELVSTVLGEIICHLLRTSMETLPFSSSVRVELASGVLSSKVCDEMKLIFKIRNAFAHSPVSLSFDTAAVARECQKITVLSGAHLEELFPSLDLQKIDWPNEKNKNTKEPPLLMTDEVGNLGFRFDIPGDQSPKSRYISAVGLLTFGLIGTRLSI